MTDRFSLVLVFVQNNICDNWVYFSYQMMTVTTVTGETDETLGMEVAVMVEGIIDDKMMTGEVNLTKVYLLALELTEVMAKHLPLVLLLVLQAQPHPLCLLHLYPLAHQLHQTL